MISVIFYSNLFKSFYDYIKILFKIDLFSSMINEDKYYLEMFFKIMMKSLPFINYFKFLKD